MFQAPRKISLTFHFCHKSFIVDDVKLAELYNNSFAAGGGWAAKFRPRTLTFRPQLSSWLVTKSQIRRHMVSGILKIWMQLTRHTYKPVCFGAAIYDQNIVGRRTHINLPF